MKALPALTLSLLLLGGCGSGGDDPVVISAAPAEALVAPVATPTPLIPPVIPDPTGLVFFRDNAAPGGTGTSTRPFNDLAQAIAATNAGEAVFVFAGSGNPIVFSGVIPANVQLLGEGAGFSAGGFQVPAGTFPRLSGTLTLSQGSTLQGLQLENPTGNAVEASDTSAIILENNQFANISGHAVTLQRVQGTIRISNNRFQDDANLDPREGVLVELDQADSTNLFFQSNIFSTPDRTSSFDNGLHLVGSGTSALTLEASGNTFDIQGNGVNFQLSGSSDITAQLSSNNFAGSQLEGISLLAGQSEADSVTSDITARLNTFSSNLGPALLLRSRGTASHSWEVDQNTITAGGNFGILCVRDDTSTVNASITGNTISNALQSAIQYTSGTASGGFTVPLAGTDRLTINGNQTSGSGLSGIALNLIGVTQAALLTDNTTASPVTALLRGTNACFGAGSNTVGGALSVTVEAGFNLTFDDRGQVNPAVTFPGAGAITPGLCQP